MSVPVLTHWTLAEAVQAASDNPNWTSNIDSEGVSRATALEWAEHGAPSLVASSDALMSKFEDALPPSLRPKWGHDVAGAFPDIPRYCAGSDPRTMRRRTRVESDRAPIRIYVDMAASGGISADQYIRRGAAVLALVRATETIRPVELYSVLIACKEHANAKTFKTFTVRLPSAPLNVSLAAPWISHPAVFRKLFLGRAYKDWDLVFPLSLSEARKARTILSLGPHDVYIPGVHFDDRAIADPIAWIKGRLEDIGASVED